MQFFAPVKTGAVAFLLLLLAVWPRWVAGAELYLGVWQLGADQSFDLPVMLDSVQGLAGVNVTLNYDPALLQFEKINTSKTTAAMLHVVNDKNPGQLVVVMAGPRGISGEELNLFSLRFKAHGVISGAKATGVKITMADLMSEQLHEIQCHIRKDVSPGPLQ